VSILRTKSSVKLLARINRYKWVYLLFLPAFVFTFIFNYLPVYGIQIAFREFRFSEGIWGSKFVGLKQFALMFREYSFLLIFRNTLIISFLKVIIVFPAGIVFALFLNEISAKYPKKIIQTISYLPHFLSWIVLTGIIKELLSLEGPVNTIGQMFGMEPRLFLIQASAFVPILIISDLWQSIGWGSIIYLAAITGIPKELYDSAELDGASQFRKMRSITIPSILPVILIMFILRLGGIMNAGFDQIFNLYSPIVYEVADIIDTYVYRYGLMNANFSYSAAVGLFKNLIGVILVVMTNTLSRKIEGAI
jgi:putative aldouronate transport system permease protein